MASFYIIFHSHRDPEKKQASRDLRRHMTIAEKIIWNQVRDHRWEDLHFRRQVLIGPYIVDFYCHAKRLVIEIDGEVHFQKAEMDRERDQFLNAMGLRVIRIPNSIVFHELNKAIGLIREGCQLSEDHPTPNPSP